MMNPVSALIDALESLKNQGQRTIALSAENLTFLKNGPKGTDRENNQNIHDGHVWKEIFGIQKGKQSASMLDFEGEKPMKLNDFSCKLMPVSQKIFTNKREHWEDLRQRVLNSEDLKKHVHPGKQLVFGVGNLDAKIFFCGEAPGADEEVQGIPFVGRAGQLLTKIIVAMGLSREEVYIGNIMNWRPEMDTPTGNRPPTQEEMQFCLPHLVEQLEIVRPEAIVALGATAVSGLLGYDKSRKMSSVRGKWHEFCGVPLMITFHPSYLLRNGTNKMKRIVWEDMLNVMEKVAMPISEKQRKYFLEN
ncbi:MAG: uracil-DNA glycosylase [Puniceicoccales bacterium]|jgi:DNA polymerase|nr:uracil-DNA glycosylase [Puniceicoccales bacterium]